MTERSFRQWFYHRSVVRMCVISTLKTEVARLILVASPELPPYFHGNAPGQIYRWHFDFHQYLCTPQAKPPGVPTSVLLNSPSPPPIYHNIQSVQLPFCRCGGPYLAYTMRWRVRNRSRFQELRISRNIIRNFCVAKCVSSALRYSVHLVSTRT